MKSSHLLKSLLPLFLLLISTGCTTPPSVVEFITTYNEANPVPPPVDLPKTAIPFSYKITTLYSTSLFMLDTLTSDKVTSSVVVALDVENVLEGTLVQVSELTGEKTGRLLALVQQRDNIQDIVGYYIVNGDDGIIYSSFDYLGTNYKIKIQLIKGMRIGNTVYAAVDFERAGEQPVALAGDDTRLSYPGEIVQLDGTQSYSPDGLEISRYNWSLQVPDGSTTILTDSSIAAPTFTTDILGKYIATLVVYDSNGIPGEPVSTTYDLSNLPPVANAGNDIISVIGDTVSLNGSGTDPEGEPLNYTWTLISSPDGSSPVLSNENSADAAVYVDTIGSYTASLIVNDGAIDSDADTVNIEVVSILDGLTNSIAELSTIVDSIPVTSLAKPKLANKLSKKLNAVMKSINKGNYKVAIKKLRKGIMSKTDGCFKNGSPDKKDYVTDCDFQIEIYESLIRIETLLMR